MRKILLVVALPMLLCVGNLFAQNVFDPNDPVITHDPLNPRTAPGPNVLAKWVRSVRMNWNTDKFKCYYWNGIAFRVRFPNGYDPNDPNKKYPLILFFHGGGEVGPIYDNEFHLLLGAQPFSQMMDYGQFDAFMIFPQTQTVAWEESQFIRINSFIDSMRKYCNVDEDRIIPMGLSIGGNAVLWYSMLYPGRSSTAIPSSPAFVEGFVNHVSKFIHIPVWIGSGGKDTNPHPANVKKFNDAFTAMGGNLLSSQYPDIVHTSWEFQWKEPNLVGYWKNAHKANPLVFYQKNQVPTDSEINVKLGISQGYFAYEWQRDGVTIAAGSMGSNVTYDNAVVSLNTGNEITVRSYGVYKARFRRTSGSPWSLWSPTPAVITANPIARAFDANTVLPYAVVLDGRASTAVAGSTIVSYKWSKVSGPASYNLLSPTSSATWINSVTKGTYIFRLTVTDDKGRSGSTDITYTVNEAVDSRSPVAVPGPNQTITIPTNSVSLNGNASTPGTGYTITSYTWSKVSGPGQFNIVSPNNATTTVDNLVAGTYVFRLTVRNSNNVNASADVTITVNNPLTPPPVANAGTNQTITMPTNSVNLDGTASTPAPGNTISEYFWTKFSGPSSGSIVTPNAVGTIVNNLETGTYVFRLKVTDNVGGTATSDVTITVNPDPNIPQGSPVANAGKDESLPVGQATVLHGEASKAVEGKSIVAYKWVKFSGPAQHEILSPTGSATWIRNMVAGTYVYRLTVTDNAGLTATDDVTITVLGAALDPTIARAGPSQGVALPNSSVTVDGSGSTPASGAVITGYNWSYISGPPGSTIVSPNSVLTDITGLIEGSYVFRLTVTDNKGASSTSDITINVFVGGTQMPVANAGKDENIPVGQATVLHGENSTAPGGAIVSFSWKKLSGPDQYEILTPNSYASWIRNMVVGTYVYRLTVTDNFGKTATDDVMITVYPKTTIGANGTQLMENDLQLKTGRFTLYPNPVRDVVNFNWSSSYRGNAVVAIYDFAGRRIQSINIRKEQADFNDRIIVNRLQKGLYFLEVRLPDGQSVIQKTFQK